MNETPQRVNSGAKFGAAGKWNSTSCQTEYVLTTNSSRVTLAEIRGGIDGYAIGKRLRDNAADLSKFRLRYIT